MMPKTSRSFELRRVAAAALTAAFVASPWPMRAQTASTLPFTFELRDAAPITIYDEDLETSDSNSPVEWFGGRAYVFVSHYFPIGHTYRRSGVSLGKLEAGAIQIEIQDDRSPGVGKWLEAT